MKKGILLFEVIMAVAVLAVGLTTVSRSFGNCIRALESARDYNMAVILSDEVFLMLELKEPAGWPENGVFEKYPGFRWSLEKGESARTGLNDVTVHVDWRQRGRDYRLSVSTLILNEET